MVLGLGFGGVVGLWMIGVFGGLDVCCSVVISVGCCNAGFLCYDCLGCLGSYALWLLLVGLWVD